MKKISCLLILLVNAAISSYAQREQDSLALVALYNSTGGATWNHKANWLSSQPISEWWGITLTDNRVSKIRLPLNQLSGLIPPEIGNLTELIEFSLWDNQLTGSIPPEIGKLIKLTRLSLEYNQLGSIPPEIGNLISLTDLSIHVNQLTGSIPAEIGNLINLTSLSLFYNQLTGSIPAEIGNLINLTSLSLYYNQLTGAIPAGIGNLINLTDLDLRENLLTGSIPPEIGNLVNLNQLSLQRNHMTGSIPLEIGNLANLSDIRLNYNQLTGSIPTEICNLINLNTIYLDNNQLTGSIPPEIGSLTKLNTLILDHNQLTGSIPAEIGNLTNLSNLYLCSNQLTGAIPGEINNLSKLACLDLNNNRFETLPKITLGGLAYLRVINNRLTFEDIEPNIEVQKNFLYSPQDSIGTREDILSCLHSSSSLSVVAGGSENIYKWYKNNTIIPSALSDTLQISDLQNTDAGSYSCVITSSLAPALTLYSRAKVIKFHPSPLSFTINGKSTVSGYEIATYSAPYNSSVTYSWSAICGNVLSLPYENAVMIQWDGNGRGYVIGYSKNQFGCVSDTSKLQISIGTTGIVAGSENHKITMYPNPTTDYITINSGDSELTQIYTLRIINLSGIPVYETRIDQRHFEFNLSDILVNGIYYFEIKDNRGKIIKVQKIILR